VLRDFFEGLPWTSLMPAPELLAAQPGESDPAQFVAVARAADGTVVIYTPCGGEIQLADASALPGPLQLIDPSTGRAITPAPPVSNTLTVPSDHDWLIVCGV
ncbi:MAG: hypothetical protein KAI66_09895, partial [Lentisphaeria bacterium]|nr:hypothetical protein [Lentisphaeria bacterium]